MTHPAPIEASAPDRRSLGVGRIGVEAVAAVFMLGLTVPWQPVFEPEINRVDYSWMLLVHHAIATGMQFGRQIVMPEGPLAFLGTDVYDPRTYPTLIVCRLIIALVAFWSLQELGRKYIRRPPAALAWMMAVILCMGASPDCFYPGCVMVLLLNYYRVRQRNLSPSAVAMLIVLAAASLMKTNQAIYGAIAVAVLTADQLAQRRRSALLPAGIYLAALAAFYLAARQSPASIGSFIRGWWLVLMGHAEGAGYPGRPTDALAYALVAALALAIVAKSEWRAFRRAAAWPMAGLAAILFLLFKHSFVRQDGFHVWIAPMALLILLVLYLPVIWRTAGPAFRAGTLIAAALTISLLASVYSHYTRANVLIQFAREFQRVGQNIQAAGDHLADPDRLTVQSTEVRRQLRIQCPLPRSEIFGAVDVYPHWQDAVFAYDLPYAPRPTCSSFVANTPALVAMNARHLAGPEAAQTILFNIDTIDRKYPTLLDSASFPELLARYDLIDDSGAMLILRQAAVPRRCVLTPLATRTGQFNVPITLPPSAGIVWVRIQFRKRLLGKLISAIYKPVGLGIDVVTSDGVDSYWRLLPDVAGQGFLLSPLIDDHGIYAALCRGLPSPLINSRRVRTITLRRDDGPLNAAFDPDFTITFQRLEIVPRH